ncbi:MAG: hypothetical protein AB7K52_10325 [Phycisphaerales bacterium]
MTGKPMNNRPSTIRKECPGDRPALVAFLADWDQIDRLRFESQALGLDGRVAVHHELGLRVLAGIRRSA